jgi:hypothetical protein
MAKEPAKADFGPEADAAARADAGAAPAPANEPAAAPAPAPGQTPGGVEVELLSDYWPAEQPEPETDPRKPSNEVRLRAGERVSLPQEEVMNLLERGIAKRVQK